jgi:hypothetical protein
MEWYCALTQHLLNANNNVTGKDSLDPLRRPLETRVVALYKSILMYQMKSVCSYYRNQGVDFLRSLANLDTWDADIQSVVSSEVSLIADWEKYDKLKTEELNSELVKLTKSLAEKLGDISQDLGKFIEQQQEKQMDSENKSCLTDLRVVNPQDDMERIETEKEELIDDVYKWILDDEKYVSFTNWGEPEAQPCQLLWVKGDAGTGKTMLLIGVIRELSARSAPLTPTLSYFFCQSTGTKTLNTATATLRSLMWMLLIQQPDLIRHLKSDYKSSGAAVFTDANALFALSRMFRSIAKDARPVYFIVDALDECEHGLEQLIKVISTSLTISHNVRWLVSSRREIDVVTKLGNPAIASILDLNTESLGGPVHAYIDRKVSALAGRNGYEDVDLADIAEEVRSRAENIFLWVWLVFKELDLEYGWHALEIIQSMPTGLPQLYDHMMTRIERGARDLQYCKDMLVAASLAYDPLSLPELVILTRLPPRVDAQTIVKKCGSFLILTKSEKVKMIHKSAKDYLSKDPKLYARGLAQAQADITRRAIDAMSRLKRDIYNLQDYGVRIEDITQPRETPLAPIRYFCVFWVSHLCEAIRENHEQHEEICSIALKFLKLHFLHWLESLSLLGKLSGGILSIRELLGLIHVC